jgi:hypothetical protein
VRSKAKARSVILHAFGYLRSQEFNQLLCDAWDGKPISSEPSDRECAMEILMEAYGLLAKWPVTPERLTSLKEHGFEVSA